MTPAKKRKHLENLIIMIKSAGFEQDRWYNWKREFQGTIYRIKLKKINIRIESKKDGYSVWRKITSKPIVKFSLTDMAKFIARFYA